LQSPARQTPGIVVTAAVKTTKSAATRKMALLGLFTLPLPSTRVITNGTTVKQWPRSRPVCIEQRLELLHARDLSMVGTLV